MELNELDPRFLGPISGLSPWDGYNSSPRKQMFASHATQRLVIDQPTERNFQTGLEREVGKYTFSVKMPVDAQIIDIIELYPQTIGEDNIQKNPLITVIYEDIDTKEVNFLDLVDHASFHQYFGFHYKSQPGLSKIIKGAKVEKDTVLLDSNAKGSNGSYMIGRNLNVAFAKVPGGAEDGLVISRDVLHKFAYRVYDKRIIEFGSKRYPLNTYGDANRYQILPEIGETVGEDSIIMALREYDEGSTVMDMSIYNLMKVDKIYDHCFYASRTGGRVIDIRVQHDPFSLSPVTPLGMENQLLKYDNARRRYHKAILNNYYKLKQQRGKYLNLHPKFSNLIKESFGVINNDDQQRIHKEFRKAPLDDWRVEVTVEHLVMPNMGGKLTCLAGGMDLLL